MLRTTLPPAIGQSARCVHLRRLVALVEPEKAESSKHWNLTCIILEFRFLNIPVRIDWSFWVFLLLIVALLAMPYLESILWAVAILLSTLVHEYGHARAALFFGAEPTIVFRAFDVRTLLEGNRLTARQDFFVILAGPCLQFALFLTACLLLRTTGTNYYFAYFVSIVQYINGLWLVFNLLPLIPLDGGWLVRYLLERRFGRPGYRASILVGLLAAVGVAPYLYYLGYRFFFVYLLMLGFQYCKLWQESR